jgi:transposase
MAFELREKTWQLGLSSGHGAKPRARTMAARDRKRLLDEVAHSTSRFGLSATAPGVSGYAAGREGCWLPRLVQAQGVLNAVGDASSIAVNRRQRRTKSEALDVRTFLRMRMR